MNQVKEELSKSGFSYCDGKYENLDSPLEVVCSEGHKTIVTMKTIRKGKAVCTSCSQLNQAFEVEIELKKPTKKQGKRVLALDNATYKTGYSIFEGRTLLTHGVKSLSQKDYVLRMIELKQWMYAMADLWEIDYIGLESVQLQENPQTLIILAKLLGVLEIASYEKTQKIVPPTSSQTWKSFCGIKGRTRSQQKENAQEFVKKKFGFIATQDAADAICLGWFLSHQVILDDMIDFTK